MVNLPSDKQPRLIFSPNDLRVHPNSDLERTRFANFEYEEIAELLQELAILERTAETKLRAWKHDTESHEEISSEIEERMNAARKRMHELLLGTSTYPEGAQLMLMPSDAYSKDYLESFQFRDRDTQEIARNITMIARFEQELETYLTRQGGYEEAERQAMVRNTLRRLEQTKDHLTKILTGYYEK
jgi:ElaB/YqjD/DUF883 family membrane-anchored ribosome-binding protein